MKKVKLHKLIYTVFNIIISLFKRKTTNISDNNILVNSHIKGYDF